MTEFTKGPWALNRYGEVINSTGEMVQVEGFALSGISRPETRANRNLLLASPEMYLALNKIAFRCESFIGDERAMKIQSIEVILNLCNKAIAQFNQQLDS